MRTLVTGGIRSGKSALAENLLGADATYVATAPGRDDDPDWAARIRDHRARRWPSSPAGSRAWDQPVADWRSALDREVSEVVSAWLACPHDVVAVTDEVGFGGIAEHRSARVFADELGRLNQAVAGASDRVLLVVAGQVLTLKDDA